ncbi:MAG: hypothetical protein U0172_04625 [Nitrospiraceae bacterium]
MAVIGGALLSSLCYALMASWHHIANQWLGLNVVYADRPLWLIAAMEVVEWLPLSALAVMVVMRWIRGTHYRPLAFGVGLLTPLLLMVSATLIDVTADDYRHRIAFDTNVWKAKGQATAIWPDRLRMVDDLIANVPLQGRTKENVLALLGPGDLTDYFQDWDQVYWLGPERGWLRIDSEWLVLRYDSAGHVSDYRLVRD